MSRTFAAVAALGFILASSAASAQILKTADTPNGQTYVVGSGLYVFYRESVRRSAARARSSS